MEQKISNEEYNEYVEQITPTYNIWKNCFHAFWIGGLICMIGEFIFSFLQILCRCQSLMLQAMSL